VCLGYGYRVSVAQSASLADHQVSRWVHRSEPRHAQPEDEEALLPEVVAGPHRLLDESACIGCLILLYIFLNHFLRYAVMPFYFAIDRGVPIVGRLLLQRSVQASIGMQWGKENNSIGDFMALSTLHYMINQSTTQVYSQSRQSQ
jgi:hypothetical protein